MQTGERQIIYCRDCKFYGVGEEGVKDCLNPCGLFLSKEFDFCSLAELKSNSEGEQNKSWLNARG